MKLTKLIAAMTLGLASVAAVADPLSSLTGPVDIKLGGLTTEAYNKGGTNETTWGIGSISSIAASTNTGSWTRGSSDGYLYYMIYGIADLSIIPNNTSGFDIYNVGATGGVGDGRIHLDIYYSATPIASIDSFKNASPANRTSYDQYSLFSALGPAYLKLTFGEGIQQTDRTGTAADERTATLVQSVNAQTLPASGDGKFFLDVVGGTAKAQWDTNGLAFGRDMSGNFTLRPNFGDGYNNNCTEAQVTGEAPTCFAGYINDPILANAAIPEPGSLALLGLGLFGLAGLRRRKSAK